MSARRRASASAPAGKANGNPGRFTLDPDDLFRPRPRRRRHSRLVRRTAGVALALALLASIVFCGLLLVTPSVSNAEILAMAQARTHHAVFPGPAVPRRFSASLVATEDHRFYAEPGIDPIAIGRVIVGRVTRGPDQGGATLYQQLAKLLYTPNGSGFVAKTEQMMLAVKLNFTYSKAQILSMYAGVAYFGHGFYGLAAASCGYFGEQPAALSWGQAAMLAGIVQAPSADDPLTHPAMARAREAHVIGRLVATHILTGTEASAALAEPVIHLTANARGGCTGSR